MVYWWLHDIGSSCDCWQPNTLSLHTDNIIFIWIFVFPFLSEWQQNRKSTFYQSMNNCPNVCQWKNKKKYWSSSDCKLLGLWVGWIYFLPEEIIFTNGHIKWGNHLIKYLSWFTQLLLFGMVQISTMLTKWDTSENLLAPSNCHNHTCIIRILPYYF